MSTAQVQYNIKIKDCAQDYCVLIECSRVIRLVSRVDFILSPHRPACVAGWDSQSCQRNRFVFAFQPMPEHPQSFSI